MLMEPLLVFHSHTRGEAARLNGNLIRNDCAAVHFVGRKINWGFKACFALCPRACALFRNNVTFWFGVLIGCRIILPVVRKRKRTFEFSKESEPAWVFRKNETNRRVVKKKLGKTSHYPNFLTAASTQFVN